MPAAQLELLPALRADQIIDRGCGGLFKGFKTLFKGPPVLRTGQRASRAFERSDTWLYQTFMFITTISCFIVIFLIYLIFPRRRLRLFVSGVVGGGGGFGGKGCGPAKIGVCIFTHGSGISIFTGFRNRLRGSSFGTLGRSRRPKLDPLGWFWGKNDPKNAGQ